MPVSPGWPPPAPRHGKRPSRRLPAEHALALKRKILGSSNWTFRPSQRGASPNRASGRRGSPDSMSSSPDATEDRGRPSDHGEDRPPAQDCQQPAEARRDLQGYSHGDPWQGRDNRCSEQNWSCISIHVECCSLRRRASSCGRSRDRASFDEAPAPQIDMSRCRRCDFPRGWRRATAGSWTLLLRSPVAGPATCSPCDRRCPAANLG